MESVRLYLLTSLLLLIILSLGSNLTYARTTPEDILNVQRETYNSRVSSYSPESKQKLETYSQKIADLNSEATSEYEDEMVHQGQILDEYLRRQGILERQADGITRNLSDPAENARYWLTYAHEAVAYQAAKVYVINLTGQTNVNRDITSQINILQSDLSILRGKVIKSQNIIKTLITKK